jgi:hypothetical protein
MMTDDSLGPWPRSFRRSTGTAQPSSARLPVRALLVEMALMSPLSPLSGVSGFLIHIQRLFQMNRRTQSYTDCICQLPLDLRTRSDPFAVTGCCQF